MEEEKKYELVKFVDGELEMEVNVSPTEETIWMSTEELAILYNIDRTGISRHIKNIYKIAISSVDIHIVSSFGLTFTPNSNSPSTNFTNSYFFSCSIIKFLFLYFVIYFFYLK